MLLVLLCLPCLLVTFAYSSFLTFLECMSPWESSTALPSPRKMHIYIKYFKFNFQEVSGLP